MKGRAPKNAAKKRRKAVARRAARNGKRMACRKMTPTDQRGARYRFQFQGSSGAD
jgi:hypothetical protein